jgi:hypothetical protein
MSLAPNLSAPSRPTAPRWSAVRPGRWSRRVATVVAALTVLFLLFDAVIHLLLIPPVVESFAMLGYPLGVVRVIAVLELVCLVLYVIPRTSVLGAVLLTAYLGGAVSAHVRVESPLFSTVLFPVYVAIALWGALLVREPRLLPLFPLLRSGSRA